MKLIQDVIERKVEKKHEPVTVLIVAIDYRVPLREPEDISALDALATQKLFKLLQATNFSMLEFEVARVFICAIHYAKLPEQRLHAPVLSALR